MVTKRSRHIANIPVMKVEEVTQHHSDVNELTMADLQLAL